MKRLAFVLVCLSLIHVTPACALDDLLMSAQQRAQIDLIRETGQLPVMEKESPAPSLLINGFFFNNRNGEENGVVWVNGKQQQGNNLNNHTHLKKINKTEKTVSVQLTETGSPVPLKAGQKLMTGEGNVQDAYQQ